MEINHNTTDSDIKKYLLGLHNGFNAEFFTTCPKFRGEKIGDFEIEFIDVPEHLKL